MMPSSVSQQLGRFDDHINTKTGGPFSPVKRSHRINPNQEVAGETKPDNTAKILEQIRTVELGKTKAVKFLSPDKMNPDKKVAAIRHGTTAAVKTKEEPDDLHHLCSFFESKLKVDDASLSVETTNIERVSPMPKEGRFTTILLKPTANEGSNRFVAVKRSLRSIDGGSSVNDS